MAMVVTLADLRWRFFNPLLVLLALEERPIKQTRYGGYWAVSDNALYSKVIDVFFKFDLAGYKLTGISIICLMMVYILFMLPILIFLSPMMIDVSIKQKNLGEIEDKNKGFKN